MPPTDIESTQDSEGQIPENLLHDVRNMMPARVTVRMVDDMKIRNGL